jgi:hypothetical protein
LLRSTRTAAVALGTDQEEVPLSPRHEASEPIPISFAPMRYDEGPPPVQMLRHRRSGISADPYRHQHEDEPIAPGESVDSWFRDQLFVAEAQHRADRALENPVLRGRDIGDIDKPWADDDLKRAKERLRIARVLGERELRDLTTTSGAPFVPAGGPPPFIASAFAVPARAAAPLAAALSVQPLPAAGKVVQAPRFTSGATAAIQATENSAVSETDPVTALAESPIGTIAGQVDPSYQLLQFGLPRMDEALSAALGASYGEALELQLINGSGSAGQMLGLLNVSGVTAVSKTNATPTAATNLAAIGDLLQQTATALGKPADTIVLHPRRKEFIEKKLGYAPVPWGVENVIVTAAMPVNLSTNQDRVIALALDEVPLFSRGPTFRLFPESGSATLTARVQTYGFGALLGNRQPTAIGVLSGSELAPPVF